MNGVSWRTLPLEVLLRIWDFGVYRALAETRNVSAVRINERLSGQKLGAALEIYSYDFSWPAGKTNKR